LLSKTAFVSVRSKCLPSLLSFSAVRDPYTQDGRRSLKHPGCLSCDKIHSISPDRMFPIRGGAFDGLSVNLKHPKNRGFPGSSISRIVLEAITH
jgi:hypothetical protein